MQRRTILIIAAAVLAFILVVVGGIAASLQPSDASQPARNPSRPTSAREVPPVDQAETPVPRSTGTAEISQEAAIQIATEYAGGGTVTSVELNTEHGVRVYEVEFANGSEVYVDLVTGRVAYAKLWSDDGREDHHDGEGRDEHR